MTRSKNATKAKDVVEMGNDSNKVMTIDTIRSIIEEIFQQQEKVVIITVSSGSLMNNSRTGKLSSYITINNEKFIKLANGIGDVLLSFKYYRK